MKQRDFLAKWGLLGQNIDSEVLEGEFATNDLDRAAAWELYVELSTRVLVWWDGAEITALESVYTLFKKTRKILNRPGVVPGEFATLAILVLNNVLRPFAAKWHRRALVGELSRPEGRQAFRSDLDALRLRLLNCTQALEAMADRVSTHRS